MEIEKLLNRAELKRLKKAVLDKNKDKIYEWAEEFAKQVNNENKRFYDNSTEKSIENILLSIVYTLHFNESTRFGEKRIESFMNDLTETIDMFNRDEAKPEDYIKQLADDRIIIEK